MGGFWGPTLYVPKRNQCWEKTSVPKRQKVIKGVQTWFEKTLLYLKENALEENLCNSVPNRKTTLKITSVPKRKQQAYML